MPAGVSKLLTTSAWWRRSNSAAFKDVNRFPSFSENWKQCIHLSRRLLNGGRRHKVGYARVATFQRNSGHFPDSDAEHQSRSPIEPVPFATCGSLRNPESFVAQPEILGIPAWHSLGV